MAEIICHAPSALRRQAMLSPNAVADALVVVSGAIFESLPTDVRQRATLAIEEYIAAGNVYDVPTSRLLKIIAREAL
jgi:hypothetical protein